MAVSTLQKAEAIGEKPQTRGELMHAKGCRETSRILGVGSCLFGFLAEIKKSRVSKWGGHDDSRPGFLQHARGDDGGLYTLGSL